MDRRKSSNEKSIIIKYRLAQILRHSAPFTNAYVKAISDQTETTLFYHLVTQQQKHTHNRHNENSNPYIQDETIIQTSYISNILKIVDRKKNQLKINASNRLVA